MERRRGEMGAENRSEVLLCEGEGDGEEAPFQTAAAQELNR